MKRREEGWVKLNNNSFQRLVVLGAPGMGKTTMFRFIAYTVARLGLGLARTDEFHLENKSNLVPLYLPLTELGGYSGDLVGCLKNYLLKRFPGCKTIITALDSLLKKGECLVLLDSLDEVAAADVIQPDMPSTTAHLRMASTTTRVFPDFGTIPGT